MQFYRRLRLKCDGTHAETRLPLSAKLTSPFKSAGSVSSVDYWQPRCAASAVVMLDTTCSEVVWRVMATHYIRQFPHHFPSLASPCVPSYFNWLLAGAGLCSWTVSVLNIASFCLLYLCERLYLIIDLTFYGWGCGMWRRYHSTRLYVHVNGKAISLQAWTGPESSSRLRLPDFKTVHEGGKVSPTHQPPLPPRKYSWYSFLLETESTPGP